MRSTTMTGAFIVIFLIAAQLGILDVSTYVRLGPGAAVAAPQKPKCPHRPIGWTGKWPPSWCYEDTSAMSKADVLLHLTAPQEKGRGAAATRSYQLVARNNGRGAADSATLILPFDPTLQAVVDVHFSSARAWVSEAPTGTLKMQLGELGGGDVVTATVRLRTLATAPIGTSLTVRAWVEWHAKANSGKARSNRLQLTITQDGVRNSLAALDMTPSKGTPSTLFKTIYDGFSSNERVSVWYHGPNGAAVGLGEFLADAEGRVDYDLSAKKLAGGRYTIVMYGQFSQVSATGEFTVSAPSP
jgi:hypothetical protein